MSKGKNDLGRAAKVWPIQVESGVLRVDSLFLAAARNQLEFYRFLEPNMTRLERTTHGIMYAATSITMLCAAMEAHANYLLDRSARGEFPNHMGLSVGACQRLTAVLDAETKWLFLSVLLTGKELLQPGQPPFQAFCDAVRTRNSLVVHPKLKEKPVGDWRELRVLTINKAEEAIGAAQATVAAVYTAMAREAPLWTRSEPGPVMSLRAK